MEKKVAMRIMKEVEKRKIESPFTMEQLLDLKAIKYCKNGRLYKLKDYGINCRIEVYKDKGVRIKIFDG